MKWIPLSERKPPQPKNICDVNEHYCALENGHILVVEYAHTTSGNHEFIWNDAISDPIKYWLEFDLPPLPEKEMSREDEVLDEIKLKYKQVHSNSDFQYSIKCFLQDILEILKTKADK